MSHSAVGINYKDCTGVALYDDSFVSSHSSSATLHHGADSSTLDAIAKVRPRPAGTTAEVAATACGGFHYERRLQRASSAKSIC